MPEEDAFRHQKALHKIVEYFIFSIQKLLFDLHYMWINNKDNKDIYFGDQSL